MSGLPCRGARTGLRCPCRRREGDEIIACRPSRRRLSATWVTTANAGAFPDRQKSGGTCQDSADWPRRPAPDGTSDRGGRWGGRGARELALAGPDGCYLTLAGGLGRAGGSAGALGAALLAAALAVARTGARALAAAAAAPGLAAELAAALAVAATGAAGTAGTVGGLALVSCPRADVRPGPRAGGRTAAVAAGAGGGPLAVAPALVPAATRGRAGGAATVVAAVRAAPVRRAVTRRGQGLGRGPRRRLGTGDRGGPALEDRHVDRRDRAHVGELAGEGAGLAVPVLLGDERHDDALR